MERRSKQARRLVLRFRLKDGFRGVALFLGDATILSASSGSGLWSFRDSSVGAESQVSISA
jgi:hypothetical protein